MGYVLIAFAMLGYAGTTVVILYVVGAWIKRLKRNQEIRTRRKSYQNGN